MPRLSFVLAALLPLAGAAFAQGGVTEGAIATAQLRPGWAEADGRRVVAIEIALGPGWKTYWRAPGAAGIPPRIDWSGSDNLASVQLHWPRPEIFETNGFATIGYHDRMVLPVTLTPRDPARPMAVAAAIELGVCREVCLPANVSVAAQLEGAGAADPVIRAALDDRPAGEGLGRLSCEVVPIKDGLRLTARFELAPRQGREAVVVEPREADVWASEAELQRDGRQVTATVDLVPPAAAPFALDRSGLTVTWIGAGRAIEARGCPAPG